MAFEPPGFYRKTRGIIRRDTRANQPAAGDVLEGTLYFVTDELVTERSNGTIWESYSGSSASSNSPVIYGLDGNDGLDSYVPGPQGVQGVQGIQGIQGINGFGLPGIDGKDGDDYYSLFPSISVGVILAGTPDYITISGNVITRGLIDLTTDVSGDLPFTNLAQGSALSVLGVTGNAIADVASIVAASDHQVLRRSGTTIAFGAINLAQSAAITGTLGFANGGTGSISFTAGSIPFSNGTILTEDTDLTFVTDTLTATKLVAPTSISTPSFISTTAVGITPAAGSNLNINLSATGDFVVNTNQLYVDTSSGNVGIGVTAPQTALDVRSAVTTQNDIRWNIQSIDTNTAASGVGGGISFGGKYTAAGSIANTFAGIKGFKENGTDDNYAGALAFITRINGGSPTERMRIDSTGNVGIGTTVFPSTGTASLIFGDETAPSGMAANTAGLYANDVAGTVEMFGIDEAGNSTQLTPHGFPLISEGPSEEMAWSFYSKNKNGKQINVDMLRAIRLIEKLTSEKLVFIQMTEGEMSG